MKRDFGRDLDIGYPTVGNLSKTVVITNFSEVTNKLDEATTILDASLAEGNANLEKIKTGIGLSISTDLDEVAE